MVTIKPYLIHIYYHLLYTLSIPLGDTTQQDRLMNRSGEFHHHI